MAPITSTRLRPRFPALSGPGSDLVLATGAAVATLLSVCIILFEDHAWLVPLVQQAAAWDGRLAAIAGMTLPAELGGAALLTLTLFLGGFLAASLLVPLTAPRRPLLLACLTLLLGYALAGFLALLALAFGLLTRSFLLAGLAATLLLLLAAALHRRDPALLALPRRLRQPPRLPHRLPAPSWPAALCALLALLVLLAAFHALLFPITEWDAVIYHAALARIWFSTAPNPPLLYGPSVGIPISSNYPPLYPGIGTCYYVALGVFEDRYLKLVSPLLYLALLLATYYAARLLAGRRTALLAALLTAVTPLSFMYAVWATSYMLSTLLILLLLTALALYFAHPSARYLLLAGVLFGLLAATSYLIMYLALFLAPVAILALCRRRLSLAHLPAFLLPAIALGLPWYLRNTLLLHDPVYPLGSALLPSLGIDRAIFQLSQDQISRYALGYWAPWSSQVELVGKQVGTLLLDRNLAPLGSLLLLPALGLALRRGSPLGLLLGGWALCLALAQLVIGWFWLRTLLLALPGVQILTAWLLVLAVRRLRAVLTPPFPEEDGHLPAGLVPRLSTRGRSAPLSATQARLALVALLAGAGIGIVPGVALGFAGPNQNTWTTALDANSEFLFPWRSIGDRWAKLTQVYGADTRAWLWLNEHLSPGRKVATLDNKIYYLRDPLSYYYLDGADAPELLKLEDPAEITDFLRAHNVEYIFVPPWVTDGWSEHPLHSRLPLTRWLGSAWFPPVLMFHGLTEPGASIVYAIGGEQQPLVSHWLGSDQSLDYFREGHTSRMTLYAPEAGFYKLTFDYRDQQYGALDIARLEGHQEVSWFRSIMLRAANVSRTADLILFLQRGFQEFEVRAYASSVLAGHMALTKLGDHIDALDPRDRVAYLQQERRSPQP